MTGGAGHALGRLAPRGRVRADLVYVGWQHAPAGPDPGPRPQPPDPTEPDAVSPDWVAAQRREDSRLARPAGLTAAAAVAVGSGAATGWLAGLLSGGVALLVTALRCTWPAVAAERYWRSNRATS